MAKSPLYRGGQAGNFPDYQHDYNYLEGLGLGVRGDLTALSQQVATIAARTGAAARQVGVAARVPVTAAAPAAVVSGGGTGGSVTVTTSGGLLINGGATYSGGTLAFTYDVENANTVFAGPVTGGATTPTWRTLNALDIPALPYVASVSLAAPTIFTVSGSPVTSTGTLTFALNTQTANLVFAGPATGAASIPTFRALNTADMPGLAGTVTITTAALTTLGTQGSMTFVNGILTAQTPAT